MATILCVDDEASSVLILEDALQQAGHKTVGVHNVQAALNVLSRGGTDLVISDYRMPGTTGLEFLAMLEREGYDITKPVRAQQLELAVDQALEFVRLRRENAQLRQEVTQLRSAREIIGESAALQRILDTVSVVAPTRATILLQGESGTGKELLARTIHNLSDRRDGPFISINCAALPESLVESTLFGHEKGAFTGAVKQVKGAFERAHRGTLLLDEISEMRLDLQAKLLRVLQEQEFERVGGTTPIQVDVRIIATTNRDLERHVKEGSFREDLFYRLSVVPVLVPPLRERSEDVPLLVQHFASRTAQEMGKTITGIAPATLDLLQQYSWPGNIRELSHAVERAVILSRDEILTPEAFDAKRFGLAPSAVGAVTEAYESTETPEDDGGTPQGRVVVKSLNISEVEEQLIEKALQATDQNRTKAADLLGISVRTLRNKLNRPTNPDA